MTQKKDAKSIIFFACAVATFIIMLLLLFVDKHANDLTSKDGVLDMRSYKFDSSTTYSLGRAFTKSDSYYSDKYYSYSLYVLLPEGLHDISISIPQTRTNLKLNINGDTVYKQNKDTMAYPCLKIIDYHTDLNFIYITLSIDKNHVIESPLTNPTRTSSLLIGTTEGIHGKCARNNFYSFIVIIVCLVSFTFHLSIFFTRKNSTVHISFCFLSLSVGISYIFTKSTILEYFFHNISASLGYKIEISAYFVSLISLVFYVRELTSENSIRKFFNILLAISVIFTIPTYFLPKQLLHLSLFTANMLFALTTLISVIIAIARKFYKKGIPQLLNSIGFLLLLLGAFSDMIYTFSASAVNSMVAYCLIVFIIMQSFILSISYQNALLNINHLTTDLKSGIYELQNNKSTYISTHINSDFLYKAMDAIRDNCEKDSDKTDKLIQALAKYLRQSLDNDVNNDYHSLKKELEICKAYALLLKEQRPEIKINFEYDSGLPDALVVRLGILTLIENAVLYAFEGVLQPKINIIASYEKATDFIAITVSDNGIGMNKDALRYALEVPNKRLGLGLYYINQQLIDKGYTGLKIESAHRKGTSVSFKLKHVEQEEHYEFL